MDGMERPNGSTTRNVPREVNQVVNYRSDIDVDILYQNPECLQKALISFQRSKTVAQLRYTRLFEKTCVKSSISYIIKAPVN
ncbi:hypothetical protein KIN20_017292 [Parelaphostrongylus tenuis]|uniref:Uncharacterized protein n=1 Tax=Parelaphostrongylus tenuis TaxID=148309 RepID=A0AAD5MID0_PARTN|nr:hypothetical protein KIN20_017292 [Parelaphostrongylus tenuis]